MRKMQDTAVLPECKGTERAMAVDVGGGSLLWLSRAYLLQLQ